MESLSELLRTAGEVDASKIVLVIALIIALIWLVNERNNGNDKKREDEFRQSMLKAQTETLNSVAAKLDNFFNLLLETQRDSKAVQLKFIESQQDFMDEIREGRQYRQKLAQQLAVDMADNKEAIESNTASIQAQQRAMDMTNDSINEVKSKLDNINEAVSKMEQHLLRMETSGGETTAVMDQLRDEIHSIRSTLDKVIAYIEQEKSNVGTSGDDIGGNLGSDRISETTGAETDQNSPEPE